MAEDRVPTWVKVGLSYEGFMTLPAAERLRLDRLHNPKEPEKRRPWETYTPSPAEQQELDEIQAREGSNAHTARWRQMRDAAQAQAEP